MESQLDGENVYYFLLVTLKQFLEDHGLTAFVGSNSFVYYEPPRKAVGPDFYVVNGGVQRRQKKWVAWLEGGLLPTLVIEFLSPSTRRFDRGRKLRLYQDVFKTADYFLFDMDRQRLEGFHLENGEYVKARADARGRIACRSLPLLLGTHEGWLRWFTPEGELLRTGEEQVAAERSAAKRERARARRERAAAERERAAAERERTRAEAAEAEVRRLQEALRRAQGR